MAEIVTLLRQFRKGEFKGPLCADSCTQRGLSWFRVRAEGTWSLDDFSTPSNDFRVLLRTETRSTHLREYDTVREAVSSLRAYLGFYNQERLHQALGYKIPYQLYTRAPGRDPCPVNPVPGRTLPP